MGATGNGRVAGRYQGNADLGKLEAQIKILPPRP
jgi:hypothetical protein